MMKSVILWTIRKNSKSSIHSNRTQGPRMFRHNFNIIASVRTILSFFDFWKWTCTVISIISAAGNSEDSDYTSDFNYPICQQQANSSASQFRNLADQLEMSPCSSPEHPNTSKIHTPFYINICIFFRHNNKIMYSQKHELKENWKTQDMQ